jgi:hypothetical protein
MIAAIIFFSLVAAGCIWAARRVELRKAKYFCWHGRPIGGGCIHCYERWSRYMERAPQRLIFDLEDM